MAWETKEDLYFELELIAESLEEENDRQRKESKTESTTRHIP